MVASGRSDFGEKELVLKIQLGLIASVLTCIAIALPVDAQNLKRIKKESDFRSIVVGRTLSDGQATLILTEDGKISGKVGANKVVGAWKWGNGFFCRNLNVGNKALGNDCQTVHTNKTEVTFTRKQGKGTVSGPFTIK